MNGRTAKLLRRASSSKSQYRLYKRYYCRLPVNKKVVIKQLSRQLLQHIGDYFDNLQLLIHTKLVPFDKSEEEES